MFFILLAVFIVVPLLELLVIFEIGSQHRLSLHDH